MSVTEDVITFRVYLKSLYFDVSVWRTKALMYKALPHAKPHDYDAICCTSTVYDVKRNAARKKPRLGEIHFYYKEFHATSVAHESAHAALWWAKRKRLDIAAEPQDGNAHPNEEAFCSAVDSLVEQISAKGAKHKIVEWTKE